MSADANALLAVLRDIAREAADAQDAPEGLRVISAICRDALAAAGGEAAPSKEPIIRWSVVREDGEQVGLSASGVIYRVFRNDPEYARLGTHWWSLDCEERARIGQPHYGFTPSAESARSGAEEHARNQPPRE